MTSSSEQKRGQVDLIVMGSGAGGLSAAVTAAAHGLRVVLLEKSRFIGGTSAMSGGIAWIPGSKPAISAGIDDSHDAIKTYLDGESRGFTSESRMATFMERGPEAVDFFNQRTALKLKPRPFVDYHPDSPGARTGGRSLMADRLDGRKLGDDLRRIHPPLRGATPFGLRIEAGEVDYFLSALRSLSSFLYVSRRLARHFIHLLMYGAGTSLTGGASLIGRLLITARKLEIKIELEADVSSLLAEEHKVVGVTLASGETIRATRGVVLATGGFPRNQEMRNNIFIDHPAGALDHSLAPPQNIGDGYRLASTLGARVSSRISNPAAWIPVSKAPRRNGQSSWFPHFHDRALPGFIAVRKDGCRFANEAQSYHDFCQAWMHASAGDKRAEAWLICDYRAISRYGIGIVPPAPFPRKYWRKSGYLIQAPSVAALARLTGIDETLVETVAQFNQHAVFGKDPEFGRGDDAYQRFLGDQTHTPNPCVAPIADAPFYAVRLEIGDAGTLAGIDCDEFSRVLDANGHPITGLYATGNDQRSVFGGAYPGGGATLGPALTFGYIAGHHAAHMEGQ